MSVDSYWRAGGCDEDFVGNYGHTDVHFWHRVGLLPQGTLVTQTHKDLVLKEMATPKDPCEGVANDAQRGRCKAAARAHARSAAHASRSRDTAANEELFRWKARSRQAGSYGEQWSNEYLRFAWVVERVD